MKNKYFNTFISNNFLVLILINLGNLFAYLFQILLGSNLSLEDYGEFNALNSLLIYVSPIAIIVPLIISRYTAIFDIRDSSKINALINYVFKNLFIVTFVILLVLLLLFNIIYQNLNITSSIHLYLTIFLISFTVIALVPIGILQGRENFFKFSIISSSTNYVKFILLLLLLYYNIINIQNVFIIIIIAVLITFFAGLFFTRDYLKLSNTSISKEEKNDLLKYILPIFISTIFLQTLIASDIIFVRLYLDPESSGLYSMAAVLSKILYFLPASLIFVLFPRVVKENELNNKSNNSLIISFSLTFLMGFIALLIIYFFKSEIIFFTFKQSEEIVSNTFFYLSLVMFLYSLVNIIIASYSAKNNFRYLYIMFFGIIIYFLLFYINHEDINSIIINMLTTSFIILIVFLIYYFIESKKITS